MQASLTVTKKKIEIPATIVALIGRFIDDYKALARLACVCKTWSTAKLEPVWEALFLHDWESDSLAEPTIINACNKDSCCLAEPFFFTNNRKKTSWRQRYTHRLRLNRQLQDRWSLGEYSQVGLWHTEPILFPKLVLASDQCFITIEWLRLTAYFFFPKMGQMVRRTFHMEKLNNRSENRFDYERDGFLPMAIHDTTLATIANENKDIYLFDLTTGALDQSDWVLKSTNDEDNQKLHTAIALSKSRLAYTSIGRQRSLDKDKREPLFLTIVDRNDRKASRVCLALPEHSVIKARVVLNDKFRQCIVSCLANVRCVDSQTGEIIWQLDPQLSVCLQRMEHDQQAGHTYVYLDFDSPQTSGPSMKAFLKFDHLGARTVLECKKLEMDAHGDVTMFNAKRQWMYLPTGLHSILVHGDAVTFHENDLLQHWQISSDQRLWIYGAGPSARHAYPIWRSHRFLLVLYKLNHQSEFRLLDFWPSRSS